jgi:hypothetical protein
MALSGMTGRSPPPNVLECTFQAGPRCECHRLFPRAGGDTSDRKLPFRSPLTAYNLPTPQSKPLRLLPPCACSGAHQMHYSCKDGMMAPPSLKFWTTTIRRRPITASRESIKETLKLWDLRLSQTPEGRLARLLEAVTCRPSAITDQPRSPCLGGDRGNRPTPDRQN